MSEDKHPLSLIDKLQAIEFDGSDRRGAEVFKQAKNSFLHVIRQHTAAPDVELVTAYRLAEHWRKIAYEVAGVTEEEVQDFLKKQAAIAAMGSVCHPRQSDNVEELQRGEICLLNPDMPQQELLLHMGEMSRDEIRVARAAIRWANTRRPMPVMGDEAKRLKIAIGGLRSIAYGDPRTWPNCNAVDVAKQALLDCGGEKYVD